MNRLQSGRAVNFGYVYPNQVQNNIALKTPQRSTYQAIERTFDQNSYDDMSGEGVMDIARNISKAGKWLWGHREGIKRGAQLASDLYASDIGKSIQNALPSSDDTARPGFAGERHAMLELPNGKFGVANYMGPSTNLIARLKRGDPPRTLSDKTAMRHDIDYALAGAASNKGEQEKMIRLADQRMVRNLDRIAKNKQDSKKNIFLGRRLIQGKMAAEDVSLMQKGSFGGPLEKISRDDLLLLNKNKDALGQEGYGLPGQQLKIRLLKAATRKTKTKTKKGSGLGLPGGALRLAGQRGLTPSHVKKIMKIVEMRQMRGEGLKDIFRSVVSFLSPVAKAVGPDLIKHVVLPIVKKKFLGAGARIPKVKLKGKGLTLPGNGLDIESFLMKKVIPSLAKSVKVDMKHLPMGKIKPIIKKAIELSKTGDVRTIAENVSRVILPIITHGKVKSLKLGMKGNGLGDFITDVTSKLKGTLAQALHKVIRMYLGGDMRGTGKKNLSGGSFWSSFAKGFTSVFKPAGKILGAVASATGVPEVGIPLTAISGML